MPDFACQQIELRFCSVQQTFLQCIALFVSCAAVFLVQAFGLEFINKPKYVNR